MSKSIQKKIFCSIVMLCNCSIQGIEIVQKALRDNNQTSRNCYVQEYGREQGCTGYRLMGMVHGEHQEILYACLSDKKTYVSRQALISQHSYYHIGDTRSNRCWISVENPHAVYDELRRMYNQQSQK